MPPRRRNSRKRQESLPVRLYKIAYDIIVGCITLVETIIKVVKWWWRLPPWLKWGKLAAILILVFSFPAYYKMIHWLNFNSLQTQYYNHFYAYYSKVLVKDEDARRMAKYYADFYADYYSSPAYRANLQYALPLASKETMSFPPDSKIAGLHINQNGLKLIKQFEGVRLEPYKDVGGKLTIGYGHLVRPGEYYTRMTQAQAHALLQEDIKVAEAYVKRYVKVPLNGNQFAALVSLVYNIGPGNFQKSTLLDQINQGNYARASSEFLRWERVGIRKVKGLSKRRAAEKQLFES